MNWFLQKYRPVYAPEGDGQQQQQQQQQQAPLWHAGIEADTIGFWQNKGYAIDEPKALATELTKQYRSLERHVGAPPDRLIRLPEKTDDVAGWNGVFSKLGVPAEAKDYDLTTVKHADGKDVDPALADSLRAALFKGRVPKDAAPEVVKTVIKSLDDKQAADATVRQAKIDAERAELKKNWGPNFDFNHLKAMEGVRKLGISPEGVIALENQIGYAAVMDAMRKIGAGTSEDAFHEGGGGGGNPTTLAGAQARLGELMADKEWGKRLIAGDAATKAEWLALTTQIAAAA